MNLHAHLHAGNFRRHALISSELTMEVYIDRSLVEG